ncbi:MAG TPA: cation diffusion facilitator family transporter [Polyangiaceae bacterium]|nr:cation diffusion facilitator family transporter [Polyangiaceae bacterium]
MAEGPHTPTSREQSARQVSRVLWVTLGLNVLVAGAKIAYGHATGVLSIRADGFHSLTDSVNNLVGLLGVYFASRPADAGHPYGHAKFEVLAAGVVGLSLLGMAYDVLTSASGRLLGHAAPPKLDALAFVVLAVTLGINLLVARYERQQADALGSPFLASDAAHTSSDVLVTLGVIVTVGFVQAGYTALDAVMALGIAGFIAWAGVQVLRQNLRYLADAAALETAAVQAVVLKVAGVASAHKIRTRGSPGDIHVDLHVQVARHLDVVQAHRVTHWVIDAIKQHLPGVTDVVVHTEPAAEGQPHNPLPDEAERPKP